VPETNAVGEFTSVAAMLLDRGARAPDALAYAVGGRELTWGALAQEVLRTAGALHARGLRRGDRCALILPTSAGLLRALFAAQALGAAPVVVNPSLPPEAIARRLGIVRADLALTGEGGPAPSCISAASRLGCEPEAALQEGPAREAPPLPSLAPGDAAFLQLTSGTSGEPRAAVVSHGSLRASLEGSLAALEIRPDDVLAAWVPLYHDMGLVRFALAPAFLGATCHLLEPSLAGMRAWVPTMARVGATLTSAPDFGYRVAARGAPAPGDGLRALRIASNGGEPVRRSTIEAFEERFACPGMVRPGYGLAEATLTATILRRGEALRVDARGRVSCGRAIEGLRVRIVREDGSAASPHEDGEVQVAGAAVFSGYFEAPDATRGAFTPDGWLRTGDTGALDADGHLYVGGRTRAMIKRGGALVAPREAEEAADAVQGVRLSAAVGVPREALGGTEDVVVVVEARPEVDGAEARRALAEEVARAVARALGFAPGDVRVVAPRSIPHTANGKIRHVELRRMLADGSL